MENLKNDKLTDEEMDKVVGGYCLAPKDRLQAYREAGIQVRQIPAQNFEQRMNKFLGGAAGKEFCLLTMYSKKRNCYQEINPAIAERAVKYQEKYRMQPTLDNLEGEI